MENVQKQIFRLPGLGPESYIFDKVLDKIIEVKGKLSVGLHLPFEKADHVETILREVRTTNRDEHLLFAQVGEKLGFISENIVRNAFLAIWNESYRDEALAIYQKIRTEIKD